MKITIKDSPLPDVCVEALLQLEITLINMQGVKAYVKDQLDFMREKYPHEEHGISVLHYMYKYLLAFIKDTECFHRNDATGEYPELPNISVDDK